MIKFDLQLFGGGGTTTTQSRNIPDQTNLEGGLENNAINYANIAGGTAQGFLRTANNLMNNSGNVYDGYTATANNINNGYADILNGKMPSSYSNARQQALNSELTGTVGNTINSLGSRGILNSSVTTGALNNIDKNASDSLARNYTSDMNSYANLLGNSASNNANNLNTHQNLISSAINNAGNLQNNTNNLFSTMYNGRMGTSGTTQSTSGGNQTAGLVGTLGSAAIMCFIAGTKVQTPSGDKNIEDIKLGDEVISADGIQTVTYVQKPIISLDEYITVTDGEKKVTTTSTQIFITPNGDVLATELDHVTAEVETVYDFSTTGSNTYYANGFLVRGAEYV